MDVREAITAAKRTVAEMFADEGVRNIGLEEVRFDDIRDVWLITVGFSRAWDAPVPFATALGRDVDLGRTYRVVQMKKVDGSVIALIDRQVAS